LGGELKGKKSILEIGPGGGFALKYFADMGLRAKAVETSDSSSTFMRVKLGLEVENAMLETYDNLEQFDIVMLNHVLEHFLDLRGTMGKLYKLVAPGGLLYVRVPNHDSYDRRMMGKAWPAYLPFHISYFSEESLRQLFSQTGFEVASTSSFVSERFMHGAPTFARKIGRRLLRLLGREDQYKGRTIAIIGKKNL
jgi:2-polyprenyl-3-methyl-5-hydroxy-6-metoxy-1,4-benzoquinol methylase